MKVFKHRPKMGDIIYSLPLIKHLGGGILYLDPNSPYFPGQRSLWEELYKWLIPLIRHQQYIERVEIYNGQEYDVDLDDYMNTTHLSKYDEVNIVDNHFIAQGVCPVSYEPWLKACTSRIRNTVVANSNNHHDNSVNYGKILHGDELFVGTQREADEFHTRTGYKLRNIVCENALQLAEIINGASVFIGNQSLPLAIALGLGKKCLVEQSPLYPNCIMGNYTKL